MVDVLQEYDSYINKKEAEIDEESDIQTSAVRPKIKQPAESKLLNKHVEVRSRSQSSSSTEDIKDDNKDLDDFPRTPTRDGGQYASHKSTSPQCVV